MRWFLYNILFTMGYLMMLPKFLFRMFRRGGYGKGFRQRFGVYGSELTEKLRSKRRIWIHAVSVGEVFVALAFMRAMRAKEKDSFFVLSTTTSTGHRVAEARLHDDDVLIYFPSDFPWIIRRAISRINPSTLVLTECELWPNLIRRAKMIGCTVILLNGRISESSYRGYKKLRYFVEPVLGMMDLFLVQTEHEREMLAELGADPSRIWVMGTAKYDVVSSEVSGKDAMRAWLESHGVQATDPIVVGGSTWPGEESLLLDVLEKARNINPSTRLVLVPRHAERRGEIISHIAQKGMGYIRRSDNSVHGDEPRVLLIDTTGELMAVYALATVVFVGKSLGNHGGQNFIEPAVLGKAIVVGPNVENFPVVIQEFRSADAIVQVKEPEELGETILGMLNDPERCSEYGRKALALVEEKKGALARSVEAVCDVRNADRG